VQGRPHLQPVLEPVPISDLLEVQRTILQMLQTRTTRPRSSRGTPFFAGFLLILMLSLSGTALAQNLDALLAEAEVMGASIAIIKGGEVVETWVSGERSSVTNQPITSETVFEAESLSKPMVAYIALRLIEEGKLELDKPLAEYASYSDAAHDTRYLKITTRMVLSHTSGFPNFRTPGEALSILFEPGSFFTYSGEGFLFLQETLEAITYTTLEDLARTYVFEPLEMYSSSFVWQTDFGQKIAVGHSDMGAALDKFIPQKANAAFSLHTTASDYARFMVAVQEGEGLGRGLFKDLTMAQVDALDGIFWGLGWGLQPTMRGQSIWQWGDNAGYKSFAYLEPDAEQGFVFLSNSANGMLVLHSLFESILSGPQTAVRWLNYERYDDPQYLLGRRLHYAVLAGGIDAAKTEYEAAKEDLDALAFQEDALNSLGYRLLRQGLIEESIAIFAFNVDLYSSSANAFDSLAEGHLAAGDLESALENYETSVRMDSGNVNGISMIQVIESQLQQQN